VFVVCGRTVRVARNVVVLISGFSAIAAKRPLHVWAGAPKHSAFLFAGYVGREQRQHPLGAIGSPESQSGGARFR
jgi:hypothetical protein